MLAIMAVISATSVVCSHRAREPSADPTPFIRTVRDRAAWGIVGADDVSELPRPGSAMGKSVCRSGLNRVSEHSAKRRLRIANGRLP